MYSSRAITTRMSFYKRMIIGGGMTKRQAISERAQKKNPAIEQMKKDHFTPGKPTEAGAKRPPVQTDAIKEIENYEEILELTRIIDRKWIEVDNLKATKDYKKQKKNIMKQVETLEIEIGKMEEIERPKLIGKIKRKRRPHPLALPPDPDKDPDWMKSPGKKSWQHKYGRKFKIPPP